MWSATEIPQSEPEALAGGGIHAIDLVISAMRKAPHRNLFLNGAAGKLEALLWTVPEEIAESSGMVALITHPHPLFGGTLHNKVVYQAARTLHGLGMPVLRFNFRGAGLSEGVHDDGRGEQDDVGVAVGFLAQQFPSRRIVLGGFSFGASVGLRVGCTDERVIELLGLGLPAANWDLSFLEKCDKPKLILQGDKDQYGPPETVRRLYEKLLEPKRLVIIAGGDHFFAGKLGEVRTALRDWLRERHPELSHLEGWRERDSKDGEESA